MQSSGEKIKCYDVISFQDDHVLLTSMYVPFEKCHLRLILFVRCQLKSDDMVTSCGLLANPIISAALLPLVIRKHSSSDFEATETLLRKRTPFYARQYLSAIVNSYRYLCDNGYAAANRYNSIQEIDIDKVCCTTSLLILSLTFLFKVAKMAESTGVELWDVLLGRLHCFPAYPR